MATTTYGDISQRTAAYAAVDMLAHAEPILVLSKFGQNKPLPKNKADTVKFRRPVPFAVATAPLTEGVTPIAKQMSYEDVTVQIQQYGDVIEITDKVDDLSEDPVLKDASMLAGEQAAETIEMVTYGVLKGGTGVRYANAVGGRSSVVAAISLNDIRSCVRSLKAMRARPLTSMLSGSPNYATKPIEGGYVAFCHTDVEADLRQLTGFTPTVSYGSRQQLCPEEIGSIENVRFITSPLLSSWADAGGAKGTKKSTSGTYADVYPVIFVGKESYGLVPLKGEGSITPTVLNPGKPSKSDPLGQVGYVGWKAYFACVRLNEGWMRRLETAVEAL